MRTIQNESSLLNTTSLIVLLKPNVSQRAVKKKGEHGIWQRRFWEHCMRDELDYRTHIDYIAVVENQEPR